mmetsp:Transcript_14593/g.43211  ORF Transcript_14593/g.43211 Transcript_14593/m.43211 type:complete len:434 (-) Transcript_14593:1046-2347(-)
MMAAASAAPAAPAVSKSKAELASPKEFAQSRGRSKSVGSAQRLRTTPSTPAKQNHSRGQPSAAAFATKKGKAGGGKGSWGSYDDEIKTGKEMVKGLLPRELADDDDDRIQGVVMVEWSMSPAEVKAFLEPKLLQYMHSMEVEEILRPIQALARPDLNPHVAEFIIIEGIERHDLERELVSILLTALEAHGVFGRHDIHSGFERVLKQLDDLNLDTPNAHQVVGKFMARAVADEILAPIVITSRPGPQDSDEAAAAFAKARGLIMTPQGFSRLAFVWGCSGGRSPVGELKSKISLLLGEFIITRDSEEAEACIRDLRAKQFMHEVVYQAIELAIDGRKKRDMLLLSSLLGSLFSSSVISDMQLEKGLGRIIESMVDIRLDNPRAAINLENFCHMSASFVSKTFSAKAAQLARRFSNKAQGGRMRSITLPDSIHL